MRSYAAAVVLVGVLGAGSALAQTYTVYSSSQAYVPLTGGTPVTFQGYYGADDDEGYASIPLSFSFPYYGQSFTSIGVNSNGLILVSAASNTSCNPSGSGSGCLSPRAVPSTSGTYHGFIAPWWDDLDGVGTGSVRYVQNSSEVTIEFFEWQYYANTAGGKLSFQVKLTSAGMISVHYGTHTGTGPSYGGATAGFEDHTGAGGQALVSCGPTCGVANWPTNTLFIIGQPVAADLTVPTVNLSNMVNGATSLSFTVSPTFRNIGQTDAGEFYWKAYLSTNRNLETDGGPPDSGFLDQLIFTSTTPLTCPGVSQSSDSAGVVVDPKPPPGQYYVLVEADTTGAVSEASEFNNVGSTSSYFTQGIDLVATSITGPAGSGPGNTISVNVKWFNQGTDAVGPTAFKVYLAATTTPYPATDFVLYSGSKDITGGQTVDEDLSITVPQNVPGGDFYYVLGIDPDGLIPEASETNNLVVSSAKVTMQQADLIIDSIDFVDLVTDAPTRVGFFGQQGRARVVMHNAGGADAANFKIGIAISTDANLSLLSDTIAHDEPIALLAAGASATVTFNFDIPLKDKLFRNYTTGNYFLFGMLDSYGQITELSKNNNNLMVTGPVNLRAPAQDYLVGRVDAPASAAVGEVAPLFRVIKNVGNVAGTQVSYRFYASANDIITTEDIPLGIIGAGGTLTDSGSLTLGIGGEDLRTEFVKLPPSMPPGTYYFGCIVDPGALVAELDEANNALASGSTVQVAAPALRIATSQLPDGVTGRPYNVRLVAIGVQGPETWTIDTANGNLPDGISLGTDGSLTGTPTQAVVSAFTAVVQSGNRQATARLVLRVLPPTSELEITTRALPPVVNSSLINYQATLGAAGGLMPYKWRIAAGTLPNGLLLGDDGVFSGSPRSGVTVGETVVTFEVQDSVGSRARADLRMRVVVPGALLVKNLTVPDSLVNYDYLTDLAAQNADGSPLATPLVWTLASGALPQGLNLSTQAGERGIISGKPQVAGTYAFSLQVEDAKGRADVADFIMRIFPARFRLSATNAPTALHPGDSVDYLLVSGGSNPSTTRFILYSGALPPGVSLSESGQISGTVEAENSVGIYNFVAQSKDGSGGSGLGAFTLEVTKVTRGVGCSSAPGAGGWFALLLVLAPLWLLGRRQRSGAAAIALAAALALPSAAWAQGADYQLAGPNPNTNYVTLGGGDLTQITSYSGQAVSIPFDFKFYGQQYSTVTVTQFGYAVFSGDDGTSSNMGIPHSNTYSWYPQTFVAPWWDYLSKTTGSVIRAQTVGSQPNRRLVIEWQNVVYSGSTVKFSFEVQLYEGTHQVRFAYGPSGPPTATASVGIMKGTGPSVGLAGLACTTATSGTCGPTTFPSNQSLDFLLPPDLSASGVTGDPTAYAGVAFHSSAMLKNIGGRTATQAKVRFYLGTSPGFDAGYPGLGDSAPADLASGEQRLVSASAPIPAGTVPGDYFVMAVADPDNAIAESAENNNVSIPIPIKVGPPTADLVVTSVSSPNEAIGGQTLAITRKITNIGNAAVPSAFKYTYLLSDNAVVSYSDRAISTTREITSLAEGASDEAVDQVELPADLAPGRYWMGLCADYEPTANPVSEITEINEVNNCAVAGNAFILNTGALAIVTTSLPGAAQYAAFGLRLQATGGDGQYAWNQPAGQLPPGMILTPEGDLTGTPSAAGTSSFDVKVTSGGAEVSATLSLTVTATDLPLTIVDQELPVAEFSRVYFAALVAVGGKPPYQWALKAESRLPTGLALAYDGHFEGRASDAGEFPFSVQLTDGAGTVLYKDLRIRVVTPSSMHIATARLATGWLKKDYLQPLQAVGGKAPYAWSIVKFQQLAENPTDQASKAETAIPNDFGIKIEQDSGQFVMRGAPGKAGLFALTLRVQDSSTVPNEDITTLPLTVTYEEGLAITTVALPDAFVGRTYIARLSHNGGVQVDNIQYSVPCVKQVAANLEDYGCAATDPMQTLPPGLILGADGALSGTPSPLPAVASGQPAPVTYSFLVKVTDAQGRQDVRGLSIKVRPDYDEQTSSCSGVPLAPSLSALAAAVLLALRGRRRR